MREREEEERSDHRFILFSLLSLSVRDRFIREREGRREGGGGVMSEWSDNTWKCAISETQSRVDERVERKKEGRKKGGGFVPRMERDALTDVVHLWSLLYREDPPPLSFPQVPLHSSRFSTGHRGRNCPVCVYPLPHEKFPNLKHR